MTGRLVLVGTPIGNLGDLSPRAVEALTSADTIACEDTRRTRALLAHLGVPGGRRLLAVHDHNEAAAVRDVVDRLDEGERLVVVTDAGMPGISDPGERLVAAAAAAGHRVEVVPGPSALLAALVVSGLSTSRFVFEGFLPRKGSTRAQRLAELAGEARTVILFEAPHRVRQTVTDLAAAAGGLRRVVLVRELTKLHEEVWRGRWPAPWTTSPSTSREASSWSSWTVHRPGPRPARTTSSTPCAPVSTPVPTSGPPSPRWRPTSASPSAWSTTSRYGCSKLSVSGRS